MGLCIEGNVFIVGGLGSIERGRFQIVTNERNRIIHTFKKSVKKFNSYVQ